eukprot:1146583-Pelagomonas_calceolata.AAC.4
MANGYIECVQVCLLSIGRLQAKECPLPFTGVVSITSDIDSQYHDTACSLIVKAKNNETTTEALKTLPTSIKERRHIGSKSRESPSPEGKRKASVGLVGFWQHAAPGHQSYVE